MVYLLGSARVISAGGIMDSLHTWVVSTPNGHENRCLDRRLHNDSRLPFYSWIRLILLSYLVLPQTQGAKLLYFSYISPFIEQHEHDIEVFISNAHERAASVGLSYVKKLIDLFRERVLGLPPPQAQQAPPPQPQSYGTSYAANLLSRFSIPSARVPAAPSTSDIYSLLSSAISSGAAATQASSTPSKSPTLTTPPTSTQGQSLAEKLTFLASQREKLTQLLNVVDREQSSLATEKSIQADIESRMRSIDPSTSIESPSSDRLSPRKRNKSEHSFENIERDDLPGDNTDIEDETTNTNKSPSSNPSTSAAADQGRNRRTQSGSWIPSSWWGGGVNTTASASQPSQEREKERENERAQGTGFQSTDSH